MASGAGSGDEVETGERKRVPLSNETAAAQPSFPGPPSRKTTVFRPCISPRSARCQRTLRASAIRGKNHCASTKFPPCSATKPEMRERRPTRSGQESLRIVVDIAGK